MDTFLWGGHVNKILLEQGGHVNGIFLGWGGYVNGIFLAWTMLLTINLNGMRLVYVPFE